MECFEGKDLSELVSQHGVGGEEEEDDDDDEWAASFGGGKPLVTPEALEQDLSQIKALLLGALRGMKDAHEAGYMYESDGSQGPFLSDVVMRDGRVKLLDVEPLRERGEEVDGGEFSAEALVLSPIGEYVRQWWIHTAKKIGIDPNAPAGVPAPLQRVLDGYGTLNWILFKWERKDLQGDQILDLVINGPQKQVSVDASLEAHWEDFMSRAFVMLGPRRFDEVKAMTAELNAGTLGGKDLISRSRYVMGAEFESLHLEYLSILKQLGYDLTR